MRLITTTALAAAMVALAACSTDTETTTEAPETEAVDTDVTVATDSAVLDANSATAEQLAAIEGIDAVTAESIVNARPFADIVAFNAMLVEAVGEDQAAAIRETLFVPIDLNNASEDAIKLVPGIDDKMVHEFLEYRPYADMAEFDREIGKYVDEAEVARYRQYVTL
ncbi:hypothetical protein [Sphingomicrobium arenosum]|uniref:hypothetical protein n=1 Tax=Sphingomicrobium arenosum TaxID=2233861 RepID=UPI00224078AE|nr:hypothetical protein [Sphingomicrobium arenosum]